MQSVSFQVTGASITGGGENRGLTRDEIKKMKSSEMIEKGKGGVKSNAMSASVSNKAENRRAYVLSMVASFDEKYILSGDSKGVITLWNNQKRAVHKLFFGHRKQVNTLCFYPKSHAFFSGSDDKRIIEWRWEGERSKNTSKIIQSKYMAHKGKISAIAISPDGKTLISGDDLGKILLWSFRPTDTPVFELSGHKGRITKLAFTKNGEYFVSSSEDNTLRIWNIERQQTVQLYAPEHYPVTTFVISPSEYFILSAGKTNLTSIRLWKLRAAITEYEKTYGK